MSQGKIHPKATVPFAWENKPGISKIIHHHHHHHHHERSRDTGNSTVMKLPPPPPCPSEKARVSVHNAPWTFLRSSSSKGSIGKPRDQMLDPFLIAYEECTRTPAPSSQYRSSPSGNGKSGWFGQGLIRRDMFDFLCKFSCSVRDDSMVKMQSCRLMNLTSKGDGRGV